MNKLSDCEQVHNGLGNRVIDILTQAVTKAGDDLSEYRHTIPDIAAQHSEVLAFMALLDCPSGRRVHALARLPQLVEAPPTWRYHQRERPV